MTIPMDVDFMEVLQSITSKELFELEEDEKAFLRARRFYLTPGQLEKFASILSDVEVPTPSERPKVKRAKKQI